MTARLEKTTAIALVCYCRQADRSVDRVLGCPLLWPEFVAYYDEHKRAAISELVALLQRAGAGRNKYLSREYFAKNTFKAIIWNLIGPVVNKGRLSWPYSEKELSFICTTLTTLLGVLQLPELPQNGQLADLWMQQLVHLRMDLWMCQWIINWKMVGVPEMRDSVRIEHFLQPEFLEYLTMHQMGVDLKEVSV